MASDRDNGVDAHGRIANHPNEFRADSTDLEYFDGGLALGYLRRLEVLLDASPVDIYAASSLKHPWPYRLQNIKECYPSSFWRSQNRILDSAILAPEYSNREILETADSRHATAVVAKDYLPFDAYDYDELSDEQVAVLQRLDDTYQDNRAATTDSIREFAALYDADTHPPAYIPLQPPYDDHYQTVRSIVESSDLDHRYMLGGLAQADPSERIDHLLDFRDVAGPEPEAHGLGWGLDDELVAVIRDEPDLLDSVDNSSPQNAIRNDKVLNKHWQATDCVHVDGIYRNTVSGAWEFAMLVQATHRLTDYNDDDLTGPSRQQTQQTFDQFTGVASDDD